jgi:hypothetical protein
MRDCRKLMLPAVIFCAASLSVPVQASAATQTADCKIKKAAFAASNDVTEITSKTYVNLTAVPFHQGGKQAGCIVVRFDAQTYQNATMQVRAMLDGSIMFPGETGFTQVEGFVASTHGFSWEGVAAPGDHTLQIQVLSSDGSAMYAISHVLSVQHR